MVSHHPAQAVQHTQLALKHALTGQPGPVAVIFHSSTACRVVSVRHRCRAIYPQQCLSAEAIAVGRRRRARGRRRGASPGAERPVIVAGNGVRLAGGPRPPCDSLAEVFDAPVATTASGKGVFPEDDPRRRRGHGPVRLGLGQCRRRSRPTWSWPSARSSAPSDTMNENLGLLDPPARP